MPASRLRARGRLFRGPPAGAGTRGERALRTVRLALLWHMHQPHYEDAAAGEFALPWVRLHAAKDYVDMVERLRGHPGVRTTFNLVPSLLEQLESYQAGMTDAFERVASVPSEELDDAGKRFHLRHFLSLHPNMGAGRWARVGRLQEGRPRNWAQLSAPALERLYGAQDYRDMAALFHLAWVDERHWEAHGLTPLAARGEGFSEAEKRRVLEVHRALIARVVPAYREASQSGSVEISASPYYHPILPLLLDPRCAREALPEIRLPARQWHFPEDARRQVRSALEFMERRLGRRPRGMWPSEGSVSPDTARLLASEDIAWAATDEGVLARSLGLQTGPERPVREHLYQPYRLEHEGRTLHMFFRDQTLSDQIGFFYQDMPAAAAVEDFLARLRRIGATWRGEHDPVVTVALDGENCWEPYPRDGDLFLETLYSALENTEWLRTVTFSDVLPEFAEGPRLEHLFSGSWIQHNFRIWIGHPEDNAAWDALLEAREVLQGAEASPVPELTPEARAEAWRHVGAAEGSDWFWWYGDEHFSSDADIFDRLFRARLAAVYRVLGRPAPVSLREPIKMAGARVASYVSPLGLLRPTLDGRVSHFYEWRLAGSIEPAALGGAMHVGRSLVRRAFFGFDRVQWFVRIDWDDSPAELARTGLEVALEIWESDRARLWLPGLVAGAAGPLKLEKLTGGEWKECGTVGFACTDSVTEIGVPFQELGLAVGDRLDFTLHLRKSDGTTEQVPAGEAIGLQVPGEDFEDTQWSV